MRSNVNGKMEGKRVEGKKKKGFMRYKERGGEKKKQNYGRRITAKRHYKWKRQREILWRKGENGGTATENRV